MNEAIFIKDFYSQNSEGMKTFRDIKCEIGEVKEKIRDIEIAVGEIEIVDEGIALTVSESVFIDASQKIHMALENIWNNYRKLSEHGIVKIIPSSQKSPKNQLHQQ